MNVESVKGGLNAAAATVGEKAKSAKGVIAEKASVVAGKVKELPKDVVELGSKGLEFVKNNPKKVGLGAAIVAAVAGTVIAIVSQVQKANAQEEKAALNALA